MKEYKRETGQEELQKLLNDEVNQILRANLYEVGLSEKELKRLRIRKRELRDALNQCGIGDLAAKEYVKNVLEDILVKKYKYGEKEWNSIIPFENRKELSPVDKFDILLYCYEKEYGPDAFDLFMKENHIMDRISAEYSGYVISEEMLDDIFFERAWLLSTNDKKKIVIQRLYSGYRGLGVIDELRDLKIDGISGGVSGKEGQHNSVWLFYHGVMIHLAFLSFGSERELERVMYDFINGDIDVLVSTTIIETGLDISNVNTMIIHDSDKYGLSQLYQLRGRIGRSNRTAYALEKYHAAGSGGETSFCDPGIYRSWKRV